MATTGKKIENLSLMTVNDMRLPTFPVGKTGANETIVTPWGDVFFPKGAPTARQGDIIYAIAACSLASRIDAVGRMHVLFDSRDVIQLINSDDWYWLKEQLYDLTNTSIAVKPKSKKNWGQTYKVLAIVGDSKHDAPRKGSQYTVKLRKVVFSELATSLLKSDVMVHCNKKVTEGVLALKMQVSRSLARWCISHSTNQNHNILTVLHAIGCGGGDRMARKYSKQIKDNDLDGLKVLGIVINGTVVQYKRPKTGIWFTNGANPNGTVIGGNHDGAEPLSDGRGTVVGGKTVVLEPLSEGAKSSF